MGSQIFGLLRHFLDIFPFLWQRKHSASRNLHCYLPQSVALGPRWLSSRSSIRFNNAGNRCISPPLAVLGVESLAFFRAVSIEIVSSLSWSQGNFPPTTCVKLIRCLLHTLTDYVTSLLRYSENHNVLKGKHPKLLSFFSHSAEVMTHRTLKREMYKTLIFPLAFGLEWHWPIGQ